MNRGRGDEARESAQNRGQGKQNGTANGRGNATGNNGDTGKGGNSNGNADSGGGGWNNGNNGQGSSTENRNSGVTGAGVGVQSGNVTRSAVAGSAIGSAQQVAPSPRIVQPANSIPMEERLAIVRRAQGAVLSAHERALSNYATYQKLSMMTPAQVRQYFPNGGFDEALLRAAQNYNRAYADYQRAESILISGRASLTGGQTLSGSVVNELNTLLGQ